MTRSIRVSSPSWNKASKVPFMNINWDQSGMPVTLVGRLGQRNEFADFKSVLNDASNQVMTPVDAEVMARELVQSGGREYVEVVRELTTALAQARQDLEDAHRRYDRLMTDLARRGIVLDECPAPQTTENPKACAAGDAADERDEWEDWNRKFQSLLT